MNGASTVISREHAASYPGISLVANLPAISFPLTMRKFSITIDIAAPADRVWEVMSDVERWPEWTASVTSVTRLTAGPFAIGTRVKIKQPKFPPAFWKVIQLEPGRSFTWESTAPGFRAVGQHSVQPISTGSRATLILDYQGLFGGLMGAMTAGITQRYVTLEANGLKARSESAERP